ncbi:MAG TPA: YihY/virulence factor BrkB family protein [Prosthecobacter sp.]|nr:YihY/virulence factor BrkB family protein [Prosthecobacter sp.]
MSPPFFERHPALGWLQRVLRMFWGAVLKFFEIDGEQRAASFAYYAFFALFPLILLFVTIGSQFFDAQTVADYVIKNLAQYMPFNPTDKHVIDRTIHGIVESRDRVSLLAGVGLLWSSTHFFHAMVRGVNRAWGTIEYPWWRLPMHSVMMLGLVASALFIGVLAPVILNYMQRLTVLNAEFFSGLFQYAGYLVPSAVLFYGLSMFFKFAPRRPTQFSEVAIPALITTVLLQVCRRLFERYVYEISNFNAVYGTFAIVVILLVWIYFSGVIIIYGGCLCAAQADIFGVSKLGPVDIPEEFDEEGRSG